MINPAFACAIYAMEDGTIRVFAPYSPTAGHLQRVCDGRSRQHGYSHQRSKQRGYRSCPHTSQHPSSFRIPHSAFRIPP